MLYLVVHNVLQGDAQLVVQRVEKVLLVHEGHPADLLHDGLCRGPFVDKVGRDGDGKLPAKLFSPASQDMWVRVGCS